jgi:hypothetical protein
MYTIRDRKTGEPIAWTNQVTLMRAMAQSNLVANVQKETFVFAMLSGPIPIDVCYIEPLPEGWPIEAGSPALRMSKINFGDK